MTVRGLKMAEKESMSELLDVDLIAVSLVKMLRLFE